MDFIPEVKMDFIPEDEEEKPDHDEEKPDHDTGVKGHFVKKEEIIELPKKKSDGMDVNDIFNMPTNDPPVRLTKKGKPFKKRPPMSEAHKEKLKLAREKAVASRQTKAKERKEMKSLDMKEKELLKKQKVHKVKQLEEEVERKIEFDVKPQIIKEDQKPVDIEKAVFEGIAKYETLRKQRKKEKQVTQAKEAEEKAVRDTLMRAVTPQKAFNPYAGCY